MFRHIGISKIIFLNNNHKSTGRVSYSASAFLSSSKLLISSALIVVFSYFFNILIKSDIVALGLSCYVDFKILTISPFA